MKVQQNYQKVEKELQLGMHTYLGAPQYMQSRAYKSTQEDFEPTPC